MKNIDWNKWRNLNEIVLFGYGRQGKKLVDKLDKYFHIIAVIDNDCSKEGVIISDNLKVIHTNHAGKILKDSKIIVCAMGRNYSQISEQLSKQYGLVENEDYMQHKFFITEWFYRFQNHCYLLKTDIFITTFCNLNCAKCASFIPYNKKKAFFDLATMKDTIDGFFTVCDYVFSVDIYGGEPFLYADLSELLEYINVQYGTRIGYLGLITNGLIMPTDRVLNMLRESKISVSISDYSYVLGGKYKNAIDTICGLFEKYGISYSRNVSLEWRDLMFPNTVNVYSGIDVVTHRECCNTTCQVLCDNKLFYCAACAAAVNGGLFPLKDKDYLDLKEDISAQQLIAFTKDGVDECYTGFCSVCAGYGEDNKRTILAGEQI